MQLLLFQIAFDELNPFPMRLINSKRELYLAEVKVTGASDCYSDV